jgi:flagellar hook-associated protein 3 FlgL
MFFRVTQHQTSAYARQSVARQTSQLYDAQRQVSSGLRVERASDDPISMRRSLIQKERISRLEANTLSLNHTRSRLDQAHVGLRQAAGLLTKARDLAIRSQQTVDETEVSVLGSELDGILDQLLNIANSADESGFLFGETSDGSLPFELGAQPDGNASYSGTTDTSRLRLTGVASVKSLLPGNEVFQPNDRSGTIVIGNTGVAVGSGTDTAVGRREAVVTHTLTSFAPGSGIAAGSGSVAGDTVIGAAGVYSLRINDVSGNGSFGTISLNDGPEISFTNLDTNLQVTTSGGLQVFVDTTAITAGFNGTVDITADGTLSVDGGASSTAITFAANQQVTDSRDGSVVNLNTAAMRRVGTDQLEFSGTADVFGVIRSLRDDILNTRGLPATERSAALSRGLGEITGMQDHLLDVVGVQSVSMEHMERLKTQLEDLQLAEQIELSDSVGADIVSVILQMQETQNAQQYTMSVIGQFLTPNLLNFIR